MRKPRGLRSGDAVAVLAPASPFDREVFARGLAEVESLGFEPRYDEQVFARRGYLAGSPGGRAADLSKAWTDPSIAGIFSVRGGYGSAQLLPLVDATLRSGPPKPLIGCSDLTSLLVYLTGRVETVAFHGPMLVNLASGEAGYDRASLLASVSTAGPAGELCPPGIDVLKTGEARGALLGGTVSLLLASLATPYAFAPPEGFVLLLDEVGEPPYRIDRMLTQLIQTGIIGRAGGIVCAEFPDCGDADGCDARSVIADLLAPFDGPVLFGFPTGHTAGPLWTVPLGVRVTVRTGSTPGLIIEEAAVR